MGTASNHKSTSLAVYCAVGFRIPTGALPIGSSIVLYLQESAVFPPEVASDDGSSSWSVQLSQYKYYSTWYLCTGTVLPGRHSR